MNISEIKANPDNPRKIDKGKLDLLKKSIKDFGKMMELRPIVINENNMILGGNQRFEAIKSLGLTEIPDNWIKRADGLTKDEQKQFIIKDNNNFGEWDFDLLNEWDSGLLAEWGLELHSWVSGDTNLDAFFEVDNSETNEKESKVCPHCGKEL